MVVVPDLRGRTLPEVLERLGRLDLQPQVEGSGLVERQSPPPGALINRGSPVRVFCTLDPEQIHAAH